MRETARVYSNDPTHRITRLTLNVEVKAPIHLSPRFVRLYGGKDRTVSRTIEIKAGLDKPLELRPKGFSLSEKVKYRIHEIEEGRRYEVRFTALPGPPQSYRGFLRLGTNYPEKPEVVIRVYGQIR